MKHLRSVLILSGLALVAAKLLPKSRRSFGGKTAVITGGSRGLGLAIARELAKDGAHLELLARDAEELERAAASLRAKGATVGTWTCDLRDADQIKTTIAAIADQRGRIDLLVNNAGIILVAPLENMRVEDFGDAMLTHFWAPLHTTLAALPHLKRTAGAIVNIASIGGRLSVPHLAPYCASKFALVGLSDSLRSELKKDGICVTTVSPGLMRTGSHINAKFKGQQDLEFTWFSLGATLPLVSIGAERAARQIVAAAQERKAELTITLQARLAVIAQAVAPGLIARMLCLTNSLLPKARWNPKAYKGSECRSPLSPSILTTLGDRASARLNEIS